MRWRLCWANCLAMLFVMGLTAILGWLMLRAVESPGWWMSPGAQVEAERR